MSELSREAQHRVARPVTIPKQTLRDGSLSLGDAAAGLGLPRHSGGLSRGPREPLLNGGVRDCRCHKQALAVENQAPSSHLREPLVEVLTATVSGT